MVIDESERVLEPVIIPSPGGVKCRVCQFTYVPDEPGNVEQHRERHERMKRGAIPIEVRELMADVGWAIACDDGRVDHNGAFPRVRLASGRERETGKLMLACRYWSRAVANGIVPDEFDEFMTAFLLWIDAKADNDESRIAETSLAIKRWERFG